MSVTKSQVEEALSRINLPDGRSLLAHEEPFDSFVHQCKPHPGQIWVARTVDRWVNEDVVKMEPLRGKPFDLNGAIATFIAQCPSPSQPGAMTSASRPSPWKWWIQRRPGAWASSMPGARRPRPTRMAALSSSRSSSSVNSGVVRSGPSVLMAATPRAPLPIPP